MYSNSANGSTSSWIVRTSTPKKMMVYDFDPGPSTSFDPIVDLPSFNFGGQSSSKPKRRKGSIIDFICEAIEAVGSHKGASYAAIYKWISENRKKDHTKSLRTFIRKAISNGLKNGLLKRSSISKTAVGVQGYFIINNKYSSHKSRNSVKIKITKKVKANQAKTTSTIQTMREDPIAQDPIAQDPVPQDPTPQSVLASILKVKEAFEETAQSILQQASKVLEVATKLLEASNSTAQNTVVTNSDVEMLCEVPMQSRQHEARVFPIQFSQCEADVDPMQSLQGEAPMQLVQDQARVVPKQSLQGEAPIQSVQDQARVVPMQSVQGEARVAPMQSVEGGGRVSSMQSVEGGGRVSSMQSVQDQDGVVPMQSVQDQARVVPMQSVQDQARVVPMQSVQDQARVVPMQSVQDQARVVPMHSLQGEARVAPMQSVEGGGRISSMQPVLCKEDHVASLRPPLIEEQVISLNSGEDNRAIRPTEEELLLPRMQSHQIREAQVASVQPFQVSEMQLTPKQNLQIIDSRENQSSSIQEVNNAPRQELSDDELGQQRSLNFSSDSSFGVETQVSDLIQNLGEKLK